MATKAEVIANPNSCLNLAADGEPIFVLRANDELAADMIRIWAALYNNRKNAVQPWTRKQDAKHRQALEDAWQMDQWRRKKEG
jgi:hypothetical protein